MQIPKKIHIIHREKERRGAGAEQSMKEMRDSIKWFNVQATVVLEGEVGENGG